MIVEDSASTLALYKSFLLELDQNLVIHDCVSVEDARTVLENNDVDLILLDMILPGVDGADFLHEIHQRSNGGHIPPIIIITATPDSSILKTSFRDYVADYLHKPVDKAELLNVVKTHLSNRGLTTDNA